MKTTYNSVIMVSVLLAFGAASHAGTLVLDGIDDYVSVPDAPSLDLTTNLTFEAWVKFRQVTRSGGGYDWQCLCAKSAHNSSYGLMLYTGGTQKTLRLYHTGASPATTDFLWTDVTSNQWYHVAVTFGSGSAKVYIDGELKLSNSVSGSLTPNALPLQFGYSASGGYPFDGHMDEVRLWAVERTAAQLQARKDQVLTGGEAGLVVYHRFDEGIGTMAHDSSPNGNNGTLVNSLRWSLANAPVAAIPLVVTETPAALSDRAVTLTALAAVNTSSAATRFEYGAESPSLSFDGASQYVHVTGFGTNAPTREITIEFWQKTDTVRAQATLVLNPDNSGNRINAHVPWSDGLIYWDFGNASDAGRLAYRPPVSLVGTWHHFALVASQSGNYMRIYRNGVLEAQKAGMSPFTRHPADLLIGGRAGYRFAGQLDEFRLWDKARSAVEIQADLYRSLTGTETNLVAYWRMDEGSGVVVADSSKTHLDGLLVNLPYAEMWKRSTRPSYEATSPLAASTPVGAALQLDGIDDYVEVPAGAWFHGDFCIEAWVNPQSHGNWSRVIDFGNGPNADNILLAWTRGTSGQPTCEVRRGSTIVGSVTATQPIPLNTWSHLAVTLQESALTIYVNGAVVGTSSSQAPNGVIRTRNYVGRSNWADSYANASIDEVRIWSVARSRSEIVASMNQQIKGNTPGLRGCWRFDESDGLVALDSSTNTHHAVLTNGAVRVAFQRPSITLADLTPGATYHFRATCVDGNGVRTFGENQVFTTINPAAGNALAFDGVDDSVRVGASVIPSSGDFTVEAWALLPSLPIPFTVREILSQGSSGNAFYLGFHTDRSIRVGDGWSSSGVTLPVGEWTHFAVVKTANNTLLYTNGVLAKSKGSTIPNPAAVGFFDIGRQYGNYGEFWPGNIDEVRVWSVARDSDQILLNFNRRLSGSESGLLGLYSFDEGCGPVAYDHSPTQNHGLLYGGLTRTDSKASVALPFPRTQSPTDVVEDKATLNGIVSTDNTATTAWFEWGTNATLSPATENVAIYYNVGGALSSVGAVNRDGRTPAAVQSFTNIYANWGTGPAWADGPGDYFGTRYNAQIFTPRDGLYTLFLNSDDGSQLYIDGKLVVNFDGLHGATGDVAGSVYLAQGKHFLEVFQFENAGAASLFVSWSGPGLPKEVIPLKALQEPVLSLLSNTPPKAVLTVTQAVTATISNLWPGTHYYRLVAANASGTNCGPVRQFEVLNPYSLTAVSFDGFGDYVLTPNLRSFFANETVTLELWFNANGPGVLIDELGAATVPNSPWRATSLELVTNGSAVEVRARVWSQTAPPANPYHIVLGTITYGTWNHAVLRYDRATKRLDGFLNGTPATNGTPPTNSFVTVDRLSPAEQGNGQFYALGTPNTQNLGSGLPFNGLMDEFRIWNVARTDQQIMENYNQRLFGTEPGLVGYYRFDDRTGFTASDSSGNGNTANLYTSANVPASPGNGPTWMPSTALANYPQAITLAALPVQAKSATLHGMVNPSANNTSARFEWGTTTNYGYLTPPQPAGAGISLVPVDFVLTGLDPGVTYHYRVRAGNGIGQAIGEDRTFTTLTVGVGWPVATKVSQWELAATPRHALDSAGNVYLSGIFSVTPGSAGAGLYGSGATNLAFVSKLSARGDWVWTTNVFSASNSMVRIQAIAVDRGTNVYVAGHFAGTNRFGDTALISANDTNAFLAKLDSAGRWLWAIGFGGAGPDSVNAVAFGTNGHVFVAGQFSGANVAFGGQVRSAAGGSDIFLGRLSQNGSWDWVQTAGTAADGEAAMGIAADAQRVFVTGRFSGTGVFGLNSAGAGDLFVTSFDHKGLLQFSKRGGGSSDDFGSALALDTGGNLYVLGRFTGAATYDNSQLPIAGANLIVMRLRSSLALDWFTAGPAVKADSIAVDAAGYVYVTGEYEQTVLFGDRTLTSAGATDLFVAQLPASVLGSVGRWNWVNSIGDLGVEGRGSVAVDPTGDVLVTGSFQNSLELGYVSVSVLNNQDILVARLRRDGTYEHNTWTIGQAIPVPAEAKDTNDLPYGKPAWIILDQQGQPDANELNCFVWGEGDRQLYPVRPSTALIKWPTSKDLTNATKVVSAVGDCAWPNKPQVHIAGTPVEMDPAGVEFRFKYLDQPFTTSKGAAVDPSTMVFQATQPGYTVLQFLKTDGVQLDPLTQPSRFEVVQTVAWDNPGYLTSEAATVAVSITRPGHNDPTGKNGFVLFANAFYDGSGPDRAYDRATRSGPILPVNKIGPATNEPLVVVWYHTNENTGIAWPDEPVRYQVSWPARPDRIIIASQLGFGPFDPSRYPAASVYYQHDPALPGYNPNEEHALLIGETLYALRDDLNAVVRASEPYVLVKYRNPFNNEWKMKAVKVEAEDNTHRFQYSAIAGEEILPPKPLRFMTFCRESVGATGPYYEDYNGRLYARAAGPLNTAAEMVLHWFYPLHPSFFYQLTRAGSNDVPVGACVPWLDYQPNGIPGVPTDVTYNITWPTIDEPLAVGENLFNPKRGMPAIRNWASASVIHDQANPFTTNAINSLVRLYDPVSERVLQLRETGNTDYLAAGGYGVFFVSPTFDLVANLATANVKGRLVFVDLPYSIRSRLFYDPLNMNLIFSGVINETADYGGPDNPLLLVNVMTEAERDRIKRLDGDQPAGAESDFDKVVEALFDLTRNPNRLDLDRDGTPDKAWLVGLAYGYVTNIVEGRTVITTNIVHEQLDERTKLLTAAPGTGSGYVTVVQNDDSRLAGLPVTLSILRVAGGPYGGDLKVLRPDNVFDEKLTIRHSADFGGIPEGLEFEWYYQPATNSEIAENLPYMEDGALVLNGWTLLKGGRGVNDVTLGDGMASGKLTLFDNYIICRYRGYSINGETNWSDWVGEIGGQQAQLASGWIKRVILGLNPFEARAKDFHDSPTATYASMIRQAGGRYEGDIAFNPSADNLNNVGLLAAYETVLRRGRRLSIDSSEQINDPAANDALLLAAGRIAEFYMLLGNEAYADAADPTIGFRTDQAGYGTLAPSIFTFQNQLDSLLEEELALLRGRDDRSATVRAGSCYNRLFWNFTKNDGEVAYSQTYNISDQNGDGLVNAEDARIMYPQGHGDAWGHYLTATKTYYSLLRNPNYTWQPRAEDILLAGVPVQVDYQDERKFALAASAKAKTGAEIVDLSYRLHYVDDPAGQYQGYKDTLTDRAWGLSGWARRAGQGAYFDWVTANAILPAVDPNTNHTGIQKIDRTTVRELSEIISAYNTVQAQLDKADKGLNPLGLAKNVVPFDIDPTLIDAGKTHFEQVYDRSISVMNNAVTVFNHANQLSQSLRALQDTVDNFANNASQQESDYKNRLIEIYGYPYAGDVGAGGTYPSGYDGPDLYHYMYVNTVDLNGETAPASQTFTGFYSRIQNIEHGGFFFPEDAPANPGDRFTNSLLQVNYPFTASDFGFVAPAGWGQRRAPGEIQLALSDLVQREARLKRAQLNYDNLLQKIEDQMDLITARYGVAAETVRIRDKETREAFYLSATIVTAKATQRALTAAKEKIIKSSEILIEGFPKLVGLANDVFSAQRSIVKGLAFTGTTALTAGAVTAEVVAEGAAIAKTQLEKQASREIEDLGFTYEVRQQFKLLEDLLREEAVLRTEAFELAEAVEQSSGRYLAALAKGSRLAEERAAFRARAAAETQENRYRDMTFRIFRNDAIQKYRAQFDLASQYVFLAAVAYDFETQLLGGDNGAGREFLTDVIRQRSLGQMENGVPIGGRHGLADPLARLGMNFGVLKGQMGFNNPQTETGRFSLRNELLRLGSSSPAEWQAELKKMLVPNLWDIPEFRRHCRPFAPESAGSQPGLVVRFPTTITFGLNYFGWPLGGGDSAYDPSLFATKVRSVGVWFQDYNGAGLSVTPRVYLVPVGADVMRSPSGQDLQTREWRVVDQKIPVPFPIGYSSLQNPDWIPANNSLSDTLADIRRFSSFRAYHDSGYFTEAEVISDSRLIGRSVWNTEWMLIIPGGTFLYDPSQGLEAFINSVSDIKIFFQTYSYSGN